MLHVAPAIAKLIPFISWLFLFFRLEMHLKRWVCTFGHEASSNVQGEKGRKRHQSAPKCTKDKHQRALQQIVLDMLDLFALPAARENSVEFKDGFKKFLSQQPSMMEATWQDLAVKLLHSRLFRASRCCTMTCYAMLGSI